MSIAKTARKTKKTTEVLDDFRLACESREASLLGRKEVFMGKAKFGIFGDGKELAQIAMAKVFRKGDFRSGYYRDQTFMLAIGELTLQQYFAQLYAHTDVEADPASAGRLMNGHFATRMLDDEGRLKNISQLKTVARIFRQQQGRCPDSWDWPMPHIYSVKEKIFIPILNFQTRAMKLLSGRSEMRLPLKACFMRQSMPPVFYRYQC